MQQLALFLYHLSSHICTCRVHVHVMYMSCTCTCDVQCYCISDAIVLYCGDCGTFQLPAAACNPPVDRWVGGRKAFWPTWPAITRDSSLHLGSGLPNEVASVPTLDHCRPYTCPKLTQRPTRQTHTHTHTHYNCHIKQSQPRDVCTLASQWVCSAVLCLLGHSTVMLCTL